MNLYDIYCARRENPREDNSRSQRCGVNNPRTMATRQYTESAFLYNVPGRVLPGGRPPARSVYTETSFRHNFADVSGSTRVPKASVAYEVNSFDYEPTKRLSAKVSSEPNKLKIDRRSGSKNCNETKKKIK